MLEVLKNIFSYDNKGHKRARDCLEKNMQVQNDLRVKVTESIDTAILEFRKDFQGKKGGKTS